MPFNLAEWKQQVGARLQAWAQSPRETLGEAGAQTLFVLDILPGIIAKLRTMSPLYNG